MKPLGLLLVVVVCAALLVPFGVQAQDDGASLIANGDFMRGMSYWVRDQPCTDCWIQVQPDADSGHPALVWERTNSGSVGSAISAWQPLDFDVSSYASLWFSMDVRIDYHNLPNSGWWSDQNNGSGEYPVKVSLTFLDEQGSPFEWTYGFMITHDGGTVLRNFFIEPGEEWASFETDVFDPGQWLGPLGQQLPHPVRLTRITVGGGGWDFKGAVSNLTLAGSGGNGDTTGDGGTTGSGGTSGDDGTTGNGDTNGDLTGGDGSGGGQLGDQTGCASIVVEEYPLVSSAEDQPDHFEYRDRLTDQILGARQPWREPDPAGQVTAVNQVINPFGYPLTASTDPSSGTTSYVLYYHDSALVPDVTHVYPVAVNSSGDRFPAAARRDKPILDAGRSARHGRQCRYADLCVDSPGLRWRRSDRSRRRSERRLFYVRRAGQVVYTVTPAGPFVEPPVKSLWSWDGHWVLEVDGTVLVDGQSLNAQLGYDEIFGWRLISGCPFFFFKQNGRIGVSYGGQVLPYVYDEVAHYLCCEASMFNIGGNGTMVWFHALRDGVWHYVEMGAYPTQ